MARGIIIAGGGARGLSFAQMITRDLRRSVAAIAEINKAAHPAIRRQVGAQCGVYDSLAQALAAIPRSQADIVFVMTPDWTHLEVVRAAIPAGCHVFLEKPLATTPRDVFDILRLAYSTDKTIQVGFVLRYSVFCRKIKAIVDSGILGRLVMIQMNERLALQHGAGFCRSWHRKVCYTGGFLNEKCSHDLDLLCWFKERQAEPREVFSHGGRHFTPPRNTPPTCAQCRIAHCPWRQGSERCVFHSDGDIMDHQCFSVKFSDNTQGLFSVVAMSPVPGRDIRIFGTDGYLEGTLEQGGLRLKNYWAASGLQDIQLGFTDSHGGGDTRIVAEFLDCVDRHERSLTTVSDGARASLLAFAAEESVRTGKVIPFAGVLKDLAAERQRRKTSGARGLVLTGKGFDPNLVMRGSRGHAGFDFTIGNPTAWPLDVRLHVSSGAIRFLRARAAEDRLPMQKGVTHLMLRANERQDLRLAGRAGKIIGAHAVVMPEKAAELKQAAAGKLELFRSIERLNDEDLAKLLEFLHFNKSIREVRLGVRALMSAARRRDWLTIVRRASGYAMEQMEACLRLIQAAGAPRARPSGSFFIACGSQESFRNANGHLWIAAQPWIGGILPWGYIGGSHCQRSALIRGTSNQRLYRNEQYGVAGYRFRIRNGNYRVRLHFAETYYDQAGQRLFDVMIQGVKVMQKLDVFKTAGGKNRAWIKSMDASVTDGMLAIDFAPASDSMINGIEVKGQPSK